MILNLIVAVADNGVIGKGGGLPWHLGSDLRRFRELTLGHPLIMGRKTFEAIGKPLAGRDSVVVTNRAAQVQSAENNVFFVNSLENAIPLAAARSKARGVTDIFVIGGASIFDLALSSVSRIYLTRVHAAPEGDVYWKPRLDEDWIEVSSRDRPMGPRDDFAVTDIVLERKARA